MDEPRPSNVDDSTYTTKEVQELLGEVDNLVFEVCEMRKKQPPKILKVLKDVNDMKKKRFADEGNIRVIPPANSLLESEQVIKTGIEKLSDAEHRNARLMKAEAESKQLQATLQEQREILAALHSLLNSEYAPMDRPRIPPI
ncbi:hypothetical protein PMAYCL1PPCAC_11767 [Pristionchus mayeri]|uniref:Uncharacterized protein n=1 Tax=Pristionchus mayeri TaxID=1317129 RepID=A0AAN4ZHU0_9BILA|nr:hypothetical protein PMAYCL1PPCAC_11767 [Pristionchus mayeri]